MNAASCMAGAAARCTRAAVEAVSGLALLLALLLAAWPRDAAAQNVLALAYHDIVGTRDASTAPDAVTLEEFTQQLGWLLHEGFRPVTAAQVAQAVQQRTPLPPKAVLLSFDDAYASFYTHVWPVVRALGVPVTLAAVGSWHDPDAHGFVDVDGRRTPASRFMSLEQLREVCASGLVDVQSHTWSLHRSVLANPYGGRKPAAVARVYDPLSGDYESIEQFASRLEEDLRRNREFLARTTGCRPTVVVWPYGRYNGEALRAARRTGHALSLTLDAAHAEGASRSNETLGRKYVQQLSLSEFVAYVTRSPQALGVRRHLAFSLESMADALGLERRAAPSAAEFERVLSRLVDSVRASGADTLFLSPYDSRCRAYFRGSSAATAADLLSRVAWHMHHRAGLKVYLDLDVSACARVVASAGEQETLFTAAHADGLVLRGQAPTVKAERSLAALVERFADLHPGKPVVASMAVPAQTYWLSAGQDLGAAAGMSGAKLPVWREEAFRQGHEPSMPKTVPTAAWGLRLEFAPVAADDALSLRGQLAVLKSRSAR